MSKDKDEDKFLKTAREADYHVQESLIRLKVDVSLGTMKAKRKMDDMSKVGKEKIR